MARGSANLGDAEPAEAGALEQRDGAGEATSSGRRGGEALVPRCRPW